MSLSLLFAGTPDFAVPALRALIDAGHAPLAVLTQPDRAAGRGQRLSLSPVKQLAIEHGIPVLQPKTLREPGAAEAIASYQPDLLITAAYGLILPPAVLALPRLGCWNLHASLLPRWRGASPINQAILHGDAETGISLMQMEAGLDTGPVLATVRTAIGAQESAGQLHDRLAPMAGQLLLETLTRAEAGRLPDAVRQDDARATHAPLIAKTDARLDWRRPAEALARAIRAYDPWPVAHAELEGQLVRLFQARPGPDLPLEPGQLLRGHGRRDAVIVACGQGSLEIAELQAAGRKRLAAADWFNAHPDWR
ncbi:MAG: methionyl-tRNA formyltransferase [Wenzhouxiangella sp.]